MSSLTRRVQQKGSKLGLHNAECKCCIAYKARLAKKTEAMK